MLCLSCHVVVSHEVMRWVCLHHAIQPWALVAIQADVRCDRVARCALVGGAVLWAHQQKGKRSTFTAIAACKPAEDCASGMWVAPCGSEGPDAFSRFGIGYARLRSRSQDGMVLGTW
jgi:hypothetical protein